MSIDINKIETSFIPTPDGKASLSEKGMIATQSPQATEAGLAMLKSGGNAIDAAVAAALALGVAEPQASGLGGQTMMLIHHNGRNIAVDGSSRAPSLAHPSGIYEGDRSIGYRAATVPSTPATLAYMLDRYGELTWQQVLEPAIELAEKGYAISALQSRLLEREKNNFEKVHSLSGARYFLKAGIPYEAGDLFKQPELGSLLRRLSEKGIQDFYTGETARRIDADMREHGGLLRYDDLALIPNPIEREPLSRPYRGLDVVTMPPPGSGRSLLFALLMLDLIPPEQEIQDEATRYMLFVHILRKTLLERFDRPFDPNFFPQIADDSNMLDPVFAHEILTEILEDVDKTVIPFLPSVDELSGETTHLSVIDKKGLAVSLTQSIERVYGSKAAADGLGFLYNNYLFDFDLKVPSHPFYLRPNAVPWATVAPTFIFHENKLWMALGSPGSERIISTLALFLKRVCDEGLSLDEAVRAPRIHCSLGGRVSLEVNRFKQSLVPFFSHKGFRIDERENFSFFLGCIQAVLKRTDGLGFQGVADPRRDGTAGGC